MWRSFYSLKSIRPLKSSFLKRISPNLRQVPGPVVDSPPNIGRTRCLQSRSNMLLTLPPQRAHSWWSSRALLRGPPVLPETDVVLTPEVLIEATSYVLPEIHPSCPWNPSSSGQWRNLKVSSLSMVTKEPMYKMEVKTCGYNNFWNRTNVIPPNQHNSTNMPPMLPSIESSYFAMTEICPPVSWTTYPSLVRPLLTLGEVLISTIKANTWPVSRYQAKHSGT